MLELPLAAGLVGLGGVGAAAAARLAVAGLPEPVLWHDLLADRKYLQMVRLSRRGGADVVFAACSEVVFGIDPAHVMPAVPGTREGYNAAIYRCMVRGAEHWLPDVVLPLLQPRVLAYGISELHLNDRMVLDHAMLEGLARSPASRWRRPVHPMVERLRTSTGPLAARSLGRPLQLGKAVARGGKRLATGSWVFPEEPGVVGPHGVGRAVEHRRFKVTERMQRVMADEVVVDWSVGGPMLASLRRLVGRVRADGVTPVFFRLPVSDAAAEYVPGGRAEAERTRSMIADTLASLDVPYLDFADAYCDEELFADLLHFNAVGRERFSTRLGRELAARPEVAAALEGRTGGSGDDPRPHLVATA